MAYKFFHILMFFFFFFSIQPFISHSRTFKPVEKPLNFLQNMKEVQKGQTVIGISEVKKYLNRFGYYPAINNNLNDHFDDLLESSLKTYQNYYNLEITGKLDFDTMKKMMIPRCGMPDVTTNITSSKLINKYNFLVSLYNFPNRISRWSHYDLTYKFGDNVPDDQGVRSAFSQAFKSWARVTRFRFQQVSDSKEANIVIAFYSGDHGDGEPFDGPRGILAHSFFPEDGRSHFDSDEPWSLKPGMNEMDLQSVAVHEFGHILGLAHSRYEDAVMYAYIRRGVVKRDLTKDDIDGIQALYSN